VSSSKRISPQLRVVRTPVDDLMARAAVQLPAPPAEPPPESEFDAPATDPQRDRATVPLRRPHIDEDTIEPASPPPAPAPKLFVVTKEVWADEDSVRMGRPTIPLPRVEQPPMIVPFQTPAELPDTLDTPQLRRGGMTGIVLALVAAVGLAGLAAAVVISRAPSPTQMAMPQPASLPSVRAPEPVRPVAVPLVVAPVKVQVHAEIDPPPPAPAPKPATRPAPIARKRIVHKAEPAAPRTSVRQGGLVDPFAGAD
jgi:hypothetical protein